MANTSQTPVTTTTPTLSTPVSITRSDEFNKLKNEKDIYLYCLIGSAILIAFLLAILLKLKCEMARQKRDKTPIRNGSSIKNAFDAASKFFIPKGKKDRKNKQTQIADPQSWNESISKSSVGTTDECDSLQCITIIGKPENLENKRKPLKLLKVPNNSKDRSSQSSLNVLVHMDGLSGSQERNQSSEKVSLIQQGDPTYEIPDPDQSNPGMYLALSDSERDTGDGSTYVPMMSEHDTKYEESKPSYESVEYKNTSKQHSDSMSSIGKKKPSVPKNKPKITKSKPKVPKNKPNVAQSKLHTPITDAKGENNSLFNNEIKCDATDTSNSALYENRSELKDAYVNIAQKQSGFDAAIYSEVDENPPSSQASNEQSSEYIDPDNDGNDVYDYSYT